MTPSLEKALRKLDRPPSGLNWVRFISDDDLSIARALVRFVQGGPRIHYIGGTKAIRDRIELGISLEAAVKVAIASGPPKGKPVNESYVRAFFEYDEKRQFSAANAIGFEPEYFRISREIAVPIAPTSIIREAGKFVPIFSCGWSKLPLSRIQRRLYMTIVEDAFLSLTDFQHAPAEFLFFPNEMVNGERQRGREIWKRNDYELLNKAELDNLVECFQSGRRLARAILLEEAEKSQTTDHQDVGAPKPPAPSTDLFTEV